ncbi:UNVERIFIED_CONTAM: hypothetical protein Sradi_3771900 [Sesamum radiatum]|uniref:Zinc knuckle CX2CX4HX4C domain-containing protein n=1 Tax=Sesamum radiatum TaxID=300843 RepID=A0AAW2PZG7_SESRA
MLNPVKGLELRRLEERRFLIRFNHIIDHSHALEGCLWSFEKNTLILSGIEKNENPMNVDLDWCEFLVHIHDLLLSKMNFGIASLIGNTLSKFRDMEMEDSGRAWGSLLRMRVALNVTLPLFKALCVCTEIGEGSVVSFMYERLQNFCYLCGQVRHIYSHCELRFEEGFQDPGEEFPYRAWLRAAPNNWDPARGPGIFGFGGDHGSATSSAGKRKRVEPVNLAHENSEQLEDSGEEGLSTAPQSPVQPSKGQNTIPFVTPFDSRGSFVLATNPMDFGTPTVIDFHDAT